jgi:hypothetical protein
MRFHPKGFVVLAVFALLLLVGLDLRWGIAAIVAIVAIDTLSFMGLFGGAGRDGGSGRKVG